MTSWLIDTNVLIYSYDVKQKHHSISYTFVEKCISGEITGILAQQNLFKVKAIASPSIQEFPLNSKTKGARLHEEARNKLVNVVK